MAGDPSPQRCAQHSPGYTGHQACPLITQDADCGGGLSLICRHLSDPAHHLHRRRQLQVTCQPTARVTTAADDNRIEDFKDPGARPVICTAGRESIMETAHSIGCTCTLTSMVDRLVGHTNLTLRDQTRGESGVMFGIRFVGYAGNRKHCPFRLSVSGQLTCCGIGGGSCIVPSRSMCHIIRSV